VDVSVTAIVPLKALGAAKQRLAGRLGAQERRDLVAWMFERVVAACRDARATSDLLVVAGNADSAALARRAGVETLMEPRPGLDAALAAADAALAGVGATLVVAADLPLVTPDDIDRVCVEAAAQRVVAVAPTYDGGTGALLRRPPRIIPTAYGPDSAARHLALAAAADVSAVRLEVAGLALDVDDADGLAAAQARMPALKAIAEP
jgi:2-phospho-L-lactate/phosphoenolpyruvate guanylyltransferase